MFRFTIRDVLWLTVVVALGCLLIVQWRRAAGLNSQIVDVERRAREPRTISMNNEHYELPEGMRRAIVEFGHDGSLQVQYEKVPESAAPPQLP